MTNSIKHVPKAGATLTGAEWESASTHTGSGLPSTWSEDGHGGVVATVDAQSKTTPLKIVQGDDEPDETGAPALIVKGAAVSADLVEFQHADGTPSMQIKNAIGQLYLYDLSGNVIGRLGGNIGLVVGAVSVSPTGAGLHIVPYLPGSDGSDALYIDGTDLSVVDGSSMIRLNNPIGDMADGFYTSSSAGNLTINADMSNGAATFLLKGVTPNGTIVGRQLPMIAGSATGSMVTRQHAAPADADLAAGDLALWFDQTNGASALKVKGKSANGTVVTATIPLT